MNMVEKVAGAIEAKLRGKEFLSYEEAARAAIEAMKEPTNEMVEAARAHHEGEAYLPYSLFNAMITAALSEESTS